jgi:hypothetical protein
MTNSRLRRVLLGVAALCIAVPGLGIASGAPGVGSEARFCKFPGTWFGVTSPTDLTLTGWVVTVVGESPFAGTNNLEYPTFDPKVPVLDPETGAFLYYVYPEADRISTLRGIWERTGPNTFAYSFMGFGLEGITPLYIAKVNGTIELSRDCRTEKINAFMSIYPPAVSPIKGEPLFTVPLPEHYGYRY